ncbi:hypothetical protein ACFOVU_11405 [Nocardiopsis sediminis]|uniref:Uncharacterized protein n=1 Tax=Nocardiopsis sediminis TaxID=1778267 RepID=A0ABV8FPB0_9ACTN
MRRLILPLLLLVGAILSLDAGTPSRRHSHRRRPPAGEPLGVAVPSRTQPSPAAPEPPSEERLDRDQLQAFYELAEWSWFAPLWDFRIDRGSVACYTARHRVEHDTVLAASTPELLREALEQYQPYSPTRPRLTHRERFERQREEEIKDAARASGEWPDLMGGA